MTRIAIALSEDFADWECALLMAVSRSYLGVEIVTASPDGRPVTSMGGLKVTPDIAYAALRPDAFDALVIPGGLAWEKGEAFDFSALAHAFHDAGKVVAGICAAASALASARLLDGLAHTGNALASHQQYPRLWRRRPLPRPAAGGFGRSGHHCARQFAGDLCDGGAEGARSVDAGSGDGDRGVFGRAWAVGRCAKLNHRTTFA